MQEGPVVVDTNTFTAAGFNEDSHSARVIDAIRDGRLRLVWNEATRAETRRVIEQIPPLDWGGFADLFRDENRYDGETDETRYTHVPDETDRKFAALAGAAGATLITADDDLLGTREEGDVYIVEPREFFERGGAKGR
jgi:predicted nucleic acid-binding protein